MRKPQIDRIKEATTAYIIALNSAETRFQVYLMENGQLECLWPHDSENGKAAKLIPGQIYSNHRNFPAYHFYENSLGMDRRAEIAYQLRRINPCISVFSLNGCSPSSLF